MSGKYALHCTDTLIAQGCWVEGNLHMTGRVELLSRARIIENIQNEPLRLQPSATVTGLML
jgi:cytoskeletal protein CcmA (bactofilin family)